MHQKTTVIRIGDFFFKYRNIVFPILWCVLFLAFKPAWYNAPREGLAIMIVALGLLTRGSVIGFAYIKRGGMNKEVYADTLVTEGFFSVCRNPLYVGNMLIYLGVFLMHGNPIVVIAGTAACFLIYQSIIAAEEFFLLQKFGDSYRGYCRHVNRWWMRLSCLPHATVGMRFNFKRVLMKDYSTIANALVTLVFLDALRHYYSDDALRITPMLTHHGMAILVILSTALLISRAKKHKLLAL